MQRLSQEVQLSFKEVNKWLWDQKQRISAKQIKKKDKWVQQCSHEHCSKLFNVIGPSGMETAASAKINDDYLMAQMEAPARSIDDSPDRVFAVTKHGSVGGT